MKDRILRPLGLQALHRQALKEVLTTLEIILQSGAQQRLAKTPGAAQEKCITKIVGKLIDVLGLVNIDKTIGSNLLKVLHAGRETA